MTTKTEYEDMWIEHIDSLCRLGWGLDESQRDVLIEIQIDLRLLLERATTQLVSEGKIR